MRLQRIRSDWEAALSISETLDGDLDVILNHFNAAAITADSGMELNEADLDDLLGIGDPGRSCPVARLQTVTGCSVTEGCGQI